MDVVLGHPTRLPGPVLVKRRASQIDLFVRDSNKRQGTYTGLQSKEYIKEGAISKRSGKGTSWKHRWLYLRQDTLSYGCTKILSCRATSDPVADHWSREGQPSVKRVFIDSVLLSEIEEVTLEGRILAADAPRIFTVRTKEDSHKLGQVYNFRATDAEAWVAAISKRVEEIAPKKPTLLWHARRHAKVLFDSHSFQIAMAVMIFGNFVVNAVEAQLVPKETALETRKLFADIDAAFTWIFAVELSVNLFANLIRPFFRDPWNWFDSIVVISSVVAFLSEGVSGVTVLRLLRVLRVFRIFRKLKSLAKIMMAIGASLPAVSNALSLMLLFSTVYAILGVQFFKDASEEHFANFGVAVYTCWNMMLIPAKAEAITKLLWVELEDEGWVTGAMVFIYVISQQLVQTFIIMKIVMAILLKEFATADGAVKGEEAALASLAMASTTSPFAGLLEDLLLLHTDRSRTLRIDELFLEMDEDESGFLSYTDLRFGLIRLDDVSPPVIIGAEGWDELIVARDFTEKVEGEQTLSMAGWRALVKNELREYVTRRTSNAVTCSTGSDGKLDAALRSLNQLADTIYLIQEQGSNLQAQVTSLQAQVTTLAPPRENNIPQEPTGEDNPPEKYGRLGKPPEKTLSRTPKFLSRGGPDEIFSSLGGVYDTLEARGTAVSASLVVSSALPPALEIQAHPSTLEIQVEAGENGAFTPSYAPCS